MRDENTFHREGEIPEWKGRATVVTTEKLTINLNVVDLGNIDLLVSEGYYSNRTDFIKNAIRRQIEEYRPQIQEIVIKKKYYVGIQKLTKESLEDTIRRGEKLDIRVVGMLIIDDDVSYDLIGKAIASINLAGVVRCGERLQKYFGK